MPAINLAICWKHFLSIVLESQSAGNLIDINLLGILREYTPEIVCCNTLLTPKAKVQERWVSYLTGLIEGDGSIIVPKTERSPKGKLNYPSIQIAFHLKDLPLALLIQKNLGFGSLIRKKGLNAYTLVINDQKGILNLVHLLNGNMKTPKINSLYKLIDWLNTKNSNPPIRILGQWVNLNKLPLNIDYLGNSAWLSGMIESDGHFSVRTTTTPRPRTWGNYPKIECKFELSQRQKDHLGYSNELFLANIAKFLKVSLKNTRENTPHPQYRLRTMSLETNLILVNYLNEYPLFGSKFLDYNNWKEILNLFNPKFRYSKENIDKILNLKKEMNDNRTIFTWNHLNNFYNLDY
uniref:LAGLIDADG homing endonuclease n=1 Tax=Termitomyces sp. TaxID=1916073 RepID=A0A3G2BRZ9_9AGAR|nr:LAGLIDADG homing endonuclease [Termitomyces sp.]